MNEHEEAPLLITPTMNAAAAMSALLAVGAVSPPKAHEPGMPKRGFGTGRYRETHKQQRSTIGERRAQRRAERQRKKSNRSR
jgi:hypothetical protein